MVSIEAYVDVSAAIVRITQNVSPNTQGYADQNIYVSCGNLQYNITTRT